MSVKGVGEYRPDSKSRAVNRPVSDLKSPRSASKLMHSSQSSTGSTRSSHLSRIFTKPSGLSAQSPVKGSEKRKRKVQRRKQQQQHQQPSSIAFSPSTLSKSVSARGKKTTSRNWNILQRCSHYDFTGGSVRPVNQEVFSSLDNFILFNLETSTKDAILSARSRLRSLVEVINLNNTSKRKSSSSGSDNSDDVQPGEAGYCKNCMKDAIDLIQLWFHQANRAAIRTGAYFILSENNSDLFRKSKYEHEHDLLIIQFSGMEWVGWQVAFDEPNLKVLECYISGPRLTLASANSTDRSTVGSGNAGAGRVDPSYMHSTSSVISSAISNSSAHSSLKTSEKFMSESTPRPTEFDEPVNTNTETLKDIMDRDFERTLTYSSMRPVDLAELSPGRFLNSESDDGDDTSSSSSSSSLSITSSRIGSSRNAKISQALHNVTSGISGLFKKRGHNAGNTTASEDSTHLNSPDPGSNIDSDNSDVYSSYSRGNSALPYLGTQELSPIHRLTRHSVQGIGPAERYPDEEPQEMKNFAVINRWLEQYYSKTLRNYERINANMDSLINPSTDEKTSQKTGSRDFHVFSSADIQIKLPFQDNSFPAVFCPGLWYSLLFSQWTPFLRELMRCMIPGAPITTLMYDFNISNICQDESAHQFSTTLELKKIFQAIRFEAIKRGQQIFPMRNLCPLFKQLGFQNVKYTVLSLKRGDYLHDIGFLNEYLSTFHYDFLVRTFLSDPSKLPPGTDPYSLPKRFMEEHMGKVDDNAGCLRAIIISAEKPL